MNGSSTAAIKAMIASTQTISSRVKPLCADSLIFCIFLQALERNISREPAAAFLTVGSVREYIVGAALTGRAIDIGVVPGIVRYAAALQIGPVPGGGSRRLPHQCGQSFRTRGKTARIEEVEVERARKALQLDLGCLDLGFAEIVEHARTDQSHDQADDRNHHQHFDQCEAGLAMV